jgi:hypothetical protein
MFEAKEQFVAVTDALPPNASPPPRANEHACWTVVKCAATATSPTGVEPVPMMRAVKLRGTVRTMVASTALHDDDEQDPLAAALKVPPLHVPGWIVTVALLDPDVYPLAVATLAPAVCALV